MNRPHFRRRPRPTDPEPYTRLDLLDGLPERTRYDAEWPDVLAAEAPVSADEWSSLPPVFVPHSFEAPGGDLAAMAAPLPGMDYRHLSAAELADAAAWAAAWLDEHRLNILPADRSGFTGIADWPVWDYGEGYEIEPEERASTEPVKPRGRHRQTDPLDLILADLRDLDGQP